MMKDQENLFNDVFVVKMIDLYDMLNVVKKIEKMDYVYKVIYGKEEVSCLFKVVGVFCNIGIVLIIGLVFMVMFLIFNIIKIIIFVRRKEIEIMKFVGVMNWFICWLFFFEGLLFGVFGLVILIVLVLSIY